MDIQTTLYPLLNDLIVLMGTILLGFLTGFVKLHYSAKQVESAKKVANVAVGFADEMAHVYGINGNEKFNTAMTQAKLLASKYGITLTDEQWTTLIKATVNEARAIYDSVQGKVEDVQPVIAETPIAPSEVVSIPETVVPDPVAVQPVVPDDSAVPVTTPSAIQSVIDAATVAGQVAYNQVVQDSIQALSLAK